MKKPIKYFINVFLFLLISAKIFSQTETFDILTYTPPKDFKKENKQGVVNYTNVNTTTGGFCVIAIYASVASTGNAEKDFKKEWKELVATPYKAEPNPKTETESTEEGWKVVTASAPVKQDGIDLYIMLSVVSGFGKTLSIRTSLNDESYIARINTLFESMELDKTAKVSVNNDAVTMQPNGVTGKFGSMIYTTPAGWKEQIFQDGVVFKPADLPAGDLLSIQIMQPLNFSGSLEQALAQSFAEATTMYNGTSMYQADGKYNKNAPQKSFNGWEYIRGKGGIQVVGGDERGLEIFVVKINNRIERIAILESRRYCGGVSRYYASDRISYRNGIEEFLYSLKFSDFNGTVLKSGSAKGNGVIGLWQGTIQSTGAATGVRLEVFSPIFFNNEQVYFGPKFPTEGLDELNSRIPPELYPRNWGTYTFSNGSGNLQMPFGNIPFRIQGDKLIVTKNQMDWPFDKLNSVDGAKFNGTYTMPKSYEMFPVINFTADGHFTDKGVMRVLGHDNNNCINMGFAPGSGTYEVKNFTVIFNYSDGRKVRIAFLGTDYDIKNQGPAVLRMSFNDDPMNRQ
ncbi:MAG: hypothetical protein JJE22_01195 [Bacteroidia bacterium]|nr:hypothetical protein [Bacteroidia bacterium]